jgi:predicted metalloprotease with PDZ domain
MDSPIEFGPVALRTFVLDGRTFRFAAHHDGTNEELDRFVEHVQAIVAEQRTVFGEYPAFEPGHYTFLADYLPYADSDGMEHRNSTVISSPSAIRSDRMRLLGTVSHEFFHTWNVERIRPRSLEPFDFESANVSSELWLAEGFTQYYGVLTLARAGLEDLGGTARALTDFVRSVALNPARLARTPDDMSRMAVFTDGARPIDHTNWSSTYVSYYPHGAAIALALDLTLRERSDGRVTLDDFMRAMWRVHGKPGGIRPGYVDRPYTLADAEARLAEVGGSPELAREFFARYVLGHEIADYERLLRGAGLALRRQRPDAAWAGPVELARGSRGLRIEAATMPGSPLHEAGLDRGDEILEIHGQRTTTEDDVVRRIAARRPGDTVALRVADRAGVERTVTLKLAADPSIEVVPAESAGQRLTEAQRAFRQRWLGSQR